MSRTVYRLSSWEDRLGVSRTLERSKLLVGSDPRCDWVLDAPGISPHHCYLVVGAEAVEVLDLASSNGVFLNGKRCRQGTLFPGDTLTLGEHAFQLGLAVDAVGFEDCEAGVVNARKADPTPVTSVRVPERSGLTLVDDEYCDLALKEEAAPVAEPFNLPEGQEDAEALDSSEETWDLVQCQEAQQVQVVTYTNGNVLDVAYLDLKQGVVLSPEARPGKVFFPAISADVRLVTAGQATLSRPEGFALNGGAELGQEWSTLTIGAHQVSLRLAPSRLRLLPAPFWGRDAAFYRETGKNAAAFFLPFLLLLLVTLPEIKPEPAKQVTIIYKAAEKTDGESKTEIAATEVTSKTENTGTKTTEQPKQRPQMAQASSAAPAQQAPAAAAKAAPKAYSFKSSVSLDSVVTDAPASATAPSRSAASTGTAGFGASTGALNGTRQGAGTGVGVGTLGSDASGSASASTGAKGLVSKKGFDHSYLEPKTVILGSMDPELLRKILQEYLPQFRHCYQQELMGAGKDLKGVIDLDFQISAAGRVSRTDVKAKDARFSRKGTDCMVAVLRIIEFPKPKGGGVVDVRQPLNFFAETEKI